MNANLENKKYPPYLFDVEFDTLASPPEPEEPESVVPPPPTFSSEELQAARDKGFQAGRAEGIDDANGRLEQQISETLAKLADGLAELAAAHREANEETMRDAVVIATTVAKKMMPEFARQHGLAEIEAVVGECLASLFEIPEVTVRAPEALAAELRTRLEPIAELAGLKGGLKIVADPNLGPDDCTMAWRNGGAERNSEKTLAEIDAVIEHFLEYRPEPSMAGDEVAKEPEDGNAIPVAADADAPDMPEEPPEEPMSAAENQDAPELEAADEGADGLADAQADAAVPAGTEIPPAPNDLNSELEPTIPGTPPEAPETPAIEIIVPTPFPDSVDAPPPTAPLLPGAIDTVPEQKK